jgi:hypothetical protein
MLTMRDAQGRTQTFPVSDEAFEMVAQFVTDRYGRDAYPDALALDDAGWVTATVRFYDPAHQATARAARVRFQEAAGILRVQHWEDGAECGKEYSAPIWTWDELSEEEMVRIELRKMEAEGKVQKTGEIRDGRPVYDRTMRRRGRRKGS